MSFQDLFRREKQEITTPTQAERDLAMVATAARFAGVSDSFDSRAMGHAIDYACQEMVATRTPRPTSFGR